MGGALRAVARRRSAPLVIDANQSSQSPVTLSDGPVESFITSELGYLSPLTRMYGQIWTSGPNVIIRYYEARPVDGEPIPICAVARLGRGGLQKKPGSRPGVAVVDFARASLFIVDAFRCGRRTVPRFQRVERPPMAGKRS